MTKPELLPALHVGQKLWFVPSFAPWPIASLETCDDHQ